MFPGTISPTRRTTPAAARTAPKSKPKPMMSQSLACLYLYPDRSRFPARCPCRHARRRPAVAPRGSLQWRVVLGISRGLGSLLAHLWQIQSRSPIRSRAAFILLPPPSPPATGQATPAGRLVYTTERPHHREPPCFGNPLTPGRIPRGFKPVSWVRIATREGDASPRSFRVRRSTRFALAIVAPPRQRSPVNP